MEAVCHDVQKPVNRKEKVPAKSKYDDKIDEVIEMRINKFSYQQISTTLGIGEASTVRLLLLNHAPHLVGCGFTIYTRDPNIIARNEEIFNLRKLGWTYDNIGNNFGLTRERIRQILEKKGADGTIDRKTYFTCELCGCKTSRSFVTKAEDICKACRKVELPLRKVEEYLEKYKERYDLMMDLRAKGETWAVCADKAGFKAKSTGNLATLSCRYAIIYKDKLLHRDKLIKLKENIISKRGETQ